MIKVRYFTLAIYHDWLCTLNISNSQKKQEKKEKVMISRKEMESGLEICTIIFKRLWSTLLNIFWYEIAELVLQKKKKKNKGCFFTQHNVPMWNHHFISTPFTNHFLFTVNRYLFLYRKLWNWPSRVLVNGSWMLDSFYISMRDRFNISLFFFLFSSSCHDEPHIFVIILMTTLGYKNDEITFTKNII